MLKPWYSIPISAIFRELDTSDDGLSEPDVKRRLQKYGRNQLPDSKVDGLFLIWLRQFQSPLIYVLLLASVLMFFLKEVTDGLIVLFVLLFNSVIGSVQEGRARNTLLSLKKYVATDATLLRDGKEMVISDTGIVPGDIIILQEGAKVPADARLIVANNLKVSEAALTGESTSVDKSSAHLIKEKLPVSEQKNMVFKGTYVAAGYGKAVAVGTGMQTMIGSISREITHIDTEIPLKANIRYFSRFIIIIVLVITISLACLGILFGRDAGEMISVAIAMSVSIVPAGLPIVLTLVLATGVWRMSKRQVLIKKMQAVEALGQATVVAVDKTGTITKNELVIQKLYANDRVFDIGGNGYDLIGEVRLEGKVVEPLNHPEVMLAGKLAAFCGNASLTFVPETELWRVSGDPTEAAIVVFSEKMGWHRDELKRECPLMAEIPFNRETKYRATINKVAGHNLLTIIGAPETVLKECKNIWRDSGTEKLKKSDIEHIEQQITDLSEDGMRVLAAAMHEGSLNKPSADNMPPMTFVGLYGMKDVLRPEVHEAMERTKEAGIKVVMITGDHQTTARAIAREAGIWQEGDMVLTGEDLQTMTPATLAEQLTQTTVFARVSPNDKLKIVQAYKKRGDVIAMTGDGVNDALSLVAADLGVSMGKVGTEVAKEASDIVLMDDNFGNIVSGVEEGRSIYKTIKKVILYLFSTSAGEVITISLALFLGYPLPLLAVHIIWLNLVTDGFLVSALAMEPKEEGLLQEKPSRFSKWLIDGPMLRRLLMMSSVMAIASFLVFSRYIDEADMSYAWTMALTTLAAFQWFNVWNVRSDKKSVFSINPFSNRYLIGATVLVVSLHMLAVYTPFMQNLLSTTPLSLQDWFIILPVASLIIWADEIRKLINRARIKIAAAYDYEASTPENASVNR